jgi:hypothetical protein
MPYRTVFDGYSLKLYRPDGSVIGSWPAISGRPGYQKPSDQNLQFQGPLSEGRYSFSVDDIQPMTTLDEMLGLLGRGRFPGSVAGWGSERVPLKPNFAPANGRSNFFIHGGLTPGSAGCIDLGPNERAYFDALRSTGERSHEVVVRYDPRLETSSHPLAGSPLWGGAGEYFTRDLPGLLSPKSTPGSSAPDAPSFDDRFGNWAPLRTSGTTPPAGLPVAPIKSDGPRGGVFDVGAPPIPFVTSGGAIPAGPDSFDERFKAASPIRRLSSRLDALIPR